MSVRTAGRTCYGCEGSGFPGDVWARVHSAVLCHCTRTCDDHVDLNAPDCEEREDYDPEECPLDPALVAEQHRRMTEGGE